MKITVKVFSHLRDFLPKSSGGKSAELDVEENATVDLVLRSLNIPNDLELLIVINGAQENKDATLKEGDVVVVFPPVDGG